MTREQLLSAQDISIQLFKAIEENQLIVAGKTEVQLNEEISILAVKEFGIGQHWHKQIVRTGKNTLSSLSFPVMAARNPPSLNYTESMPV